MLVERVNAEQAPLLARPFYTGADTSPLVSSLAHVPEVLDVTMPFVATVLGPSAIGARVKELVILRASVLQECRYCVETHTAVALECDVSRDEVCALRERTDAPAAFADPAERALVAWVDAVAGGRGAVPAAVAGR